MYRDSPYGVFIFKNPKILKLNIRLTNLSVQRNESKPRFIAMYDRKRIHLNPQALRESDIPDDCLHGSFLLNVLGWMPLPVVLEFLFPYLSNEAMQVF